MGDTAVVRPRHEARNFTVRWYREWNCELDWERPLSVPTFHCSLKILQKASVLFNAPVEVGQGKPLIGRMDLVIRRISKALL